MRIAAAALILAVSLSRLALAEEAPDLAIRCAAAVDVAHGERIDHAVVLIKGTRIVAVARNLEIPPGTPILDLGDATWIPGLIDVHTHLLLRFDARLGDEMTNAVVALARSGPASRALLGAANAREMLEAGFTTVRDLGNSGRGGDVALRDAIAAGWVRGPRMVVSTRALAPPGGQYAPLSEDARGFVAEDYVEITGQDEARRAVRQALFEGANVIKVIVDGATSLSTAELAAIVDEAHRAGSKIAAHAVSDAAVRAAVTAGVDSVEHAYGASDEVLRAMAAKRIVLVPTDMPGTAGAPEEVALERHRLARALALGVPIASGSDMYYGQPGKTRGESAKGVFSAYADSGMTAMQILQAATIDAARLLGRERDLGSLEPGKLADMVAVEGDPLTDIHALERVRAVVQGGQLITRFAAPTWQPRNPSAVEQH